MKEILKQAEEVKRDHLDLQETSFILSLSNKQYSQLTRMASTALTLLQIASDYAIYTTFITFFVGMVGNLLNILTFTNLKSFRSNSCIFYLTIESISNINYHLCSAFPVVYRLVYGYDLIIISPVWCRLRNILIQSSGLCTFYMVCLASIDQFCLTFYRLNLKQICTRRVARYLSLTIITIWIIHSIVFCSFFNIVPSVGCIISDPVLIRYGTFFFYPVLVGFLPIVIASWFSFMAFRNVRRIVRRQLPIQRRRFDRQVSAMVLVRVGFFVIFTTPFVVFRTYTTSVIVTQANLLHFAIIQMIQVIILSVIGLNYTVRVLLEDD